MAELSRASLAEWLSRLSEEAQVAFACRCALRCIPAVATRSSNIRGFPILQILQALLTASVSVRFPESTLANAVYSVALIDLEAITQYDGASLAASAVQETALASASMSFAQDSAPERIDMIVHCASKVTRCALSAEAEASTLIGAFPYPEKLERTVENALSHDLQLLFHGVDQHKSGVELFSHVLWNGNEPNGLATAYKELVAFFESDPKTWNFWYRWLEGMRNGKPLDLELQQQVALIGEEDDFHIWKDGPRAIAKEIARVEQDFRTRVDRAAVFDPDAGIFRLAEDPSPPREALEFACKRVLLALDNALASGTGNGLREDSYETIAIRSAVEQHPDDASVIAVSFFDACMSFDKRIGDEYPDEPSLTNLKNALWTTVEEITELDDPAKARVQRYVQLGQAAPLTKEEKEAVPEIVQEVTPYTDAELAARIREAGDLLKDSDQPPRSVRARFANWVTTIVTWMDKTKKGEARISWLVKQIERMRKWFPGQGGPPEV